MTTNVDIRTFTITGIILLLISCAWNYPLPPQKKYPSQGKIVAMTKKSCRDLVGNTGICMFKWDCISLKGITLSTCVDGFLFGACCMLERKNNSTFNESFSKQFSSDYQSNTISHLVDSNSNIDEVTLKTKSTQPTDNPSFTHNVSNILSSTTEFKNAIIDTRNSNQQLSNQSIEINTFKLPNSSSSETNTVPDFDVQSFDSFKFSNKFSETTKDIANHTPIFQYWFMSSKYFTDLYNATELYETENLFQETEEENITEKNLYSTIEQTSDGELTNEIKKRTTGFYESPHTETTDSKREIKTTTNSENLNDSKIREKEDTLSTVENEFSNSNNYLFTVDEFSETNPSTLSFEGTEESKSYINSNIITNNNLQERNNNIKTSPIWFEQTHPINVELTGMTANTYSNLQTETSSPSTTMVNEKHTEEFKNSYFKEKELTTKMSAVENNKFRTTIDGKTTKQNTQDYTDNDYFETNFTSFPAHETNDEILNISLDELKNSYFQNISFFSLSAKPTQDFEQSIIFPITQNHEQFNNMSQNFSPTPLYFKSTFEYQYDSNSTFKNSYEFGQETNVSKNLLGFSNITVSDYINFSENYNISSNFDINSSYQNIHIPQKLANHSKNHDLLSDSTSPLNIVEQITSDSTTIDFENEANNSSELFNVLEIINNHAAKPSSLNSIDYRITTPPNKSESAEFDINKKISVSNTEHPIGNLNFSTENTSSQTIENDFSSTVESPIVNYSDITNHNTETVATTTNMQTAFLFESSSGYPNSSQSLDVDENNILINDTGLNTIQDISNFINLNSVNYSAHIYSVTEAFASGTANNYVTLENVKPTDPAEYESLTLSQESQITLLTSIIMENNSELASTENTSFGENSFTTLNLNNITVLSNQDIKSTNPEELPTRLETMLSDSQVLLSTVSIPPSTLNSSDKWVKETSTAQQTTEFPDNLTDLSILFDIVPMSPTSASSELNTVESFTNTTSPTLQNLETTTEYIRWNYKKDCGVRLMQPIGRIVGGKNTHFGKWPWQALVKEATWLGLFIKNKCGGVLITAKYVLTAAHCQPGFLASLIVVLGIHDLGGTLDNKASIIRNVRRMVIHRHYNAQTFENDLALLEMESEIEFLPYVVPICFPHQNEDFTGKMAFVTGWGKLTHGGDVPNILQEVQVPIVGNGDCQRMFFHAGHKKAIRSNFVCAGYTNGGQDSCEGDSGGPLMVQREDRRWVLVGTVSHGIGCADPNLPGVYMRMSSYRPWIDSIIHK
ncbi:uncharacterized protein [Parasteatoda tepidariorum]|uniref:uncharacterized protein n=1 Tax=Parasteatoda tepidariorum TaxID=114398 RepID=UPI001C72920A|nr:serine-rich adhesin for platelets [Parasteatoda tepidariorum]